LPPTKYRLPGRDDKQLDFEEISEPIDYSEIEESRTSKVIINKFSHLWDLQLKSFLFEQVMKYDKSDKMQSVLSKDRKFISSIRSLEDEFRENHNQLLALQQNA
jgi:hypothetical protein